LNTIRDGSTVGLLACPIVFSGKGGTAFDGTAVWAANFAGVKRIIAIIKAVQAVWCSFIAYVSMDKANKRGGSSRWSRMNQKSQNTRTRHFTRLLGLT